MIGARLIVDKSVTEALHRGGDQAALRKWLRRQVKTSAQPTLETVMAATPRRSGLLQSSLGIAMREGMRGAEVMASIGVQDNITFMSGGRKMLVTSERKAGRAAARAARRGLSMASQRTAFVYVWGIETGRKRNGRLARRAGGARMLERGLMQRQQEYIDSMSNAVLQRITTTPTASTP